MLCSIKLEEVGCYFGIYVFLGCVMSFMVMLVFFVVIVFIGLVYFGMVMIIVFFVVGLVFLLVMFYLVKD